MLFIQRISIKFGRCGKNLCLWFSEPWNFGKNFSSLSSKSLVTNRQTQIEINKKSNWCQHKKETKSSLFAGAEQFYLQKLAEYLQVEAKILIPSPLVIIREASPELTRDVTRWISLPPWLWETLVISCLRLFYFYFYLTSCQMKLQVSRRCNF